MALKKKHKWDGSGINPAYADPQTCDHVCVYNRCRIGFNLTKTCQKCHSMFVVGTTWQAADKAAKMKTKIERDEFFIMFERRYGLDTNIRDMALKLWRAERVKDSDAKHFKKMADLATNRQLLHELSR